MTAFEQTKTKVTTTLEHASPHMDSEPSISHPLEVLEKDFLKPKGLSMQMLFKRMGYSYKQYAVWVSDCHGIDATMAARLSIALNTSAGHWLNLQYQWNLKAANEQLTTGLALKGVSGF